MTSTARIWPQYPTRDRTRRQFECEGRPPPQDKRVVKHPESEKKVWWGGEHPYDERTFTIDRQRAIDYLSA